MTLFDHLHKEHGLRQNAARGSYFPMYWRSSFRLRRQQPDAKTHN
jgi:hypothetical protein